MGGVPPARGSFPPIHPVAAMAMPMATRKSGILTLRQAKVRHDIAFRDGRATGADSNAAKESLPVLLAAKGRITKPQSQEVLRALRETRGATADQVLVERGLVLAEDMDELLRWRAAILVVKSAAWTEGAYHFRAMGNPRLPGPELALKLPQLLMQGLLRTDPDESLFIELRQVLDHQVRWASDAPFDSQDFVVEDGDEVLIGAIDGAHTLSDAITASRLAGTRAQALPWLLLATRAVETEAPASQAPSPAPPPPEPAPEPEPEEESLDLEPDDDEPAPAIATPIDRGPAIATPVDSGQAIATPVDSGQTPTASPPADAGPAPTEKMAPVDDEAARKARLAKLEASLFGDDAKPIAPKARPATWGSAEGAAIPMKGGAATPAGGAAAVGDGAGGDMRKVLKRMEKQDHFEILGVPRDADDGAVRKAYFALAKKYHPDRFTGQPDEQYQLAESIFALIGEANEALASQKDREEYLHKLEHGDEEEQSEAAAMAQVERILDAERAFKTGMRVLTNGRIPAAHEHFRRAYEGYPEEVEYQCYYGYTSYRMKLKADPLGAKGGIELIKAVLEENPNHGAALHLLGKIDMLKSDWEGAIYLLKKARRARPQDDDIRRDLRRAEHEALKPKKGEGLGSVLGGLFSKKKK